MRARELRLRDGLAVREIAHILGVSRSSVSRWVQDIELTSEQMAALRARNPIIDRQNSGTRTLVARSLARRRGFQEDGRARARTKDAFYVAGCMLYWAEGAKARNAVRFTNSDPSMMTFFLRFLRRYFGVSDERVRVSCNIFADTPDQQRRIEQTWLDILGLSKRCLRRSTVNHYSAYSKRKRRGALPYGTCRLVVNDTRIVQTIFGSIQELAGFERAEWLTG
jgi:hypothetical protein